MQGCYRHACLLVFSSLLPLVVVLIAFVFWLCVFLLGGVVACFIRSPFLFE